MITESAAPAAAPAPATAATAAAPAAASPAAAPAAASAQPGAADGQPGAASGQPGATEGTPAASTEPVLPEVYEVKAPDGLQLESTALTEFQAVAKDLKLSPESAQKLADIAIGMQQRQLEAHATMVKGWVDTAKADKEIGGDAFDENLATARKAIETFGSKELKEAFATTGLGNHPEIIRAFVKVGKAISEGRFVAAGGRAPTGAGASTAQTLYPDMNP